MSNPTIDGTGNITMFGTTQAPPAPFIAPPVVEVEPTPVVDLYNVAYRRDNTRYDDLLDALLAKVASLQATLRRMT